MLRPDAPEMLPRAATPATALAQLAAELGVSEAQPRRWVQTKIPVPALEKVLIDYGYIAHLVEKDKDGRERYARFILPTLIDPFEAWVTKYEDGTLRTRLISLFKGTRQIAIILRINRDGSLLYNAMHADDKRIDAFRKGVLLHGK